MIHDYLLVISSIYIATWRTNIALPLNTERSYTELNVPNENFFHVHTQVDIERKQDISSEMFGISFMFNLIERLCWDAFNSFWLTRYLRWKCVSYIYICPGNTPTSILGPCSTHFWIDVVHFNQDNILFLMRHESMLLLQTVFKHIWKPAQLEILRTKYVYSQCHGTL